MIVTIECDSPQVVFCNSPIPIKVIVDLYKHGIDGKSAYQIAVEKGYTGTEEEFAQMLISIDKKEDKLNFWTLIHGATARELLVKDAAGKKYKYSYGTVVLYRFIKADKTDDSFYTEIELTNKIATKKVVVNL
jgi:hypothetical protein